MKQVRIVVKIFLFLGILIGLLWAATPVFKGKWIDTTFPTTAVIKGFYEEPKNSIDVIYLGSSHVMSGVSPIEIWKETGLTGYVCGSTKLSVPGTYLYLKEAIKTQHPKVAVMDVSRIFKAYKNEYYEEDTRRALDDIHFSKDKLEVASVLMEGDDRQSLISYLFPLIRYHSRWSDLKEEDFRYAFVDKHMVSKGQSLEFTVSRFALPENFMDDVMDDEGYAIDNESIAYFEKIVNTCEENGIKLILIKTPCYSWNKTKSEMAADLAASYGVVYIDYCTPEMLKEIDFVATEDFQDEGDHLNSFGAAKVSKHLGQYMTDHNVEGREKAGNISSQWEEDTAMYDLLREDAKLNQCENLIDYLGMLKNDNYVAATAARFDAAYCITPEVIDAMRELGLAANLEEKYKAAYSAIIDGGNAVCEGIDLEEEVALSFHDKECGLEIETVSQGAESGNISSIIINGKEYSENQTGLTFVVYDKRIGEVISIKRFNTHNKQYRYGTELQSENILRNFLDLLSGENYVAFIETKGILTEEQFSDLGSWVKSSRGYEIEKKDDCCMAVIYEAGEVVAFGQNKDVTLSYSTNDISVTMHGVREEGNELASIQINGKGTSKNETGINIVVYDKRSGSIVCRKTF